LFYAQDISRDWQGTLKARWQELWTILQVEKSETEKWRAVLVSIDQSQDRGTVCRNLILVRLFKRQACHWPGTRQLHVTYSADRPGDDVLAVPDELS
jgi:hypothetical protein